MTKDEIREIDRDAWVWVQFATRDKPSLMAWQGLTRRILLQNPTHPHGRFLRVATKAEIAQQLLEAPEGAQ